MMLYMFVEILSTFLIVLTSHVAEGCGRTPSKPQSTASPLDSVTTDLPTHRQPCNEDETIRANCLHGGECYTIPLYENRTVHCLCPKIYEGVQCEQISSDIFGELQAGGKVVIGGVAAGVVVIIALVGIVIVYYVLKIRKKRQEERDHRNMNGTPGETLLKEQNHNLTKNGNYNKETNV